MADVIPEQTVPHLAPEEQSIIDWIQKKADEARIDVRMYVDLMRRDEGWIYLPIYVATRIEAHKKVRFMQNAEDSWNSQDPDNAPELQVLLIPASE